MGFLFYISIFSESYHQCRGLQTLALSYRDAELDWHIRAWKRGTGWAGQGWESPGKEPMSWSSLALSIMRRQKTRYPKHDSTVKLTTNLMKRNAKTLKTLENPLSPLLYEGSRLPLISPSMLHPCGILSSFWTRTLSFWITFLHRAL